MARFSVVLLFLQHEYRDYPIVHHPNYYLHPNSKAFCQYLFIVKEKYDIVKENYDIVNKKYDIVNKKYDIVNKKYDIVNKNYDIVNKKYDIVNKKYDIVHKKYDCVHKKYDFSGFSYYYNPLRLHASPPSHYLRKSVLSAGNNFYDDYCVILRMEGNLFMKSIMLNFQCVSSCFSTVLTVVNKSECSSQSKFYLNLTFKKKSKP